MSNIMLYDQISKSGNPIEAIEKVGESWARSGLLGIERPEQGAVVFMAAMIEGKSPLDIIRTYHVIDGRLSKRTSAILADFQSAGGRVKWLEATNEVCHAKFFHPEYQPDGVDIKLTLQELKDSGVATSRGGGLKDNYKKHARRMLRARVISEGVGVVMPNIVSGVYTPEETVDFTSNADIESTDAITSQPKDDGPAEDLLRPVTAEVVHEPMIKEDSVDGNTSLKELLAKESDEFLSDAHAYLMDLGWISADDRCEDVSPYNAECICGRFGDFKAAVRRHKESKDV